MAFARLHEIARSYVLDYLDPTGEIREKPQDVFVDARQSKTGIEKIYTNNKALSIFVSDTDLGEEYFYIGEARQCLGDKFHFGHRDDTSHDQWHKSEADFEHQHTHIIKGLTNADAKDMTKEEFNCIFDKIKEYEFYQGYCKDGKTQCFITKEKKEEAESQYAKYLRQTRRAPRIEAAADKLTAELEARCLKGAKTFTQAFLTTLLEKYIRPYLIEKGMHHTKATWSIEAIKSAITFGLSGSMVNTALDAIIRNALKPALTRLGVNANLVDMIVTEIGTVVAFAENPLSLIDMGLTGTAAAMGQGAAYAIIRALPKFKQEPEVVTPPQEDEASVVVNQKSALPDYSTVRHRQMLNH